MRVLANLCSLVPGQVGGSEVYATRLLDAVTRHGTVEVEVASMRGLRAAHPELARVAWHEARASGNSRLRRAAVESLWLPRRCEGFDVVHHFGGRLPARRAGAAVLTVYDIQPLDLPANFSPAKRAYLRWALPRSVGAARLIAVPSQWVADRLSDRLGVAAERIRVVPATYRTRPVDAEAAPIREQRFVLYPAATYPHKNHETLIKAHAAVWARHGDVKLVLTGAPGRAHAQVAEMAARAGGVTHLGHVSDARLASLMASADAVVFPSRYEGFGLPVLEAMRCGTPVIAADIGALAEVAAGAATLIGTDDVDGWVDALLEARSGSETMSAAVERGRARADDFAPERVAGRLLQTWHDATDQPKDR